MFRISQTIATTLYRMQFQKDRFFHPIEINGEWFISRTEKEQNQNQPYITLLRNAEWVENYNPNPENIWD